MIKLSSEERSRNEAVEFYGNRVHDAVRFGDEGKRTVLISKMPGIGFHPQRESPKCSRHRSWPALLTHEPAQNFL